MARERDEAACAKLVELVKRADIHDQGIDAQVHAVDVGDRDGVVRQSLGHILGHEVLEMVGVVEVVALFCCICVCVCMCAYEYVCMSMYVCVCTLFLVFCYMLLAARRSTVCVCVCVNLIIVSGGKIL